MGESRKIILPVFRLTETCSGSSLGATKVSFKNLKKDYFIRPKFFHSSKFGQDFVASFNFMPVVLQADGSPWSEANLYLTHRIINSINLSISTYSSIANDLVTYRKFLEENQIDFLNFPKFKFDRPTYLFRRYLLNQVDKGELSQSTARRKIQTVVNFYRWLMDSSRIFLENPPWTNGEAYITFKQKDGFQGTKTVKTTDISIHIPTSRNPHSEEIEDGGKLRPLTIEEQSLILQALDHFNNTKHTLIHCIALFTGARLQTVLTLRYGNFPYIPDIQDKKEIRIAVGFGTKVDTKFDKQMVLHFPVWLYEKIRIFINSPKFVSEQNHEDGDRYIFTSQSGEPYYLSKADMRKFNPDLTSSRPKTGDAIREYISRNIIPYIESVTDKKFHYRFHDLRASFGMNLTEACLKQVENKEITLLQAREYVRARMGHASAATTDLYLNFKHNKKFLVAVQTQYETHLRTLMGGLKE